MNPQISDKQLPIDVDVRIVSPKCGLAFKGVTVVKV